jgi:hypothetical protein
VGPGRRGSGGGRGGDGSAPAPAGAGQRRGAAGDGRRGRGGADTSRPRRRRGRDGARVCFLGGRYAGHRRAGQSICLSVRISSPSASPLHSGKALSFFSQDLSREPRLRHSGKRPLPRVPPFRHSIPSSIFKIQTSCGLLDQAVLCPRSSCRRSECISLISRLASNNLFQKISKYLRSSKRKNDRSISSRF